MIMQGLPPDWGLVAQRFHPWIRLISGLFQTIFKYQKNPFPCPLTLHNQSWSRNIIRSSSGAKRLFKVSGGAIEFSAFSFIAMSASIYPCVVDGDSYPSHNAITVISTPDCSKCMAVECLIKCGVTRFSISD
jgi:hypothetical protein